MVSTPITVQDALWLTMDRPNNLMVIDSVLWLHGTPDWAAVRAVVDERMIRRFPVFSSVAVRSRAGWRWRTDPGFRLERHLRRADLPRPVSVAGVQAFVSAERSRPLPRQRPLWVMHLVDGLRYPDGSVGAAVVSRMHHSLADGVRLTQVVLGLCDSEGDADVAVRAGVGRVGDPDRPTWDAGLTTVSAGVSATVSALGEAARDVVGGAVTGAAELGQEAVGAAATAVRRSAAAVASAARDPAQVLAAVPGATEALAGAVGSLPGSVAGTAAGLVGRGQDLVHETFDVLTDRVAMIDLLAEVSPLPDVATNTASELGAFLLAPHSVQTVWSGPAGVPKAVSWVAPFPLGWVKDVGQATGTTVNDVLLAVVAGTLRRYLAEHGDEVDEVLWLVPVSLVPFDAGMPERLGNHFALIPLRLPLGLADPRDRIAEVHRRTQKMKNSHEAILTFGLQRVVSGAPDQVSTSLTTYLANRAMGVLTNVPGPRSRLTLAGSPVSGVLGWAPCSGDQPMTICLFSYDDRVHVGFGVDAAAVPDADRLSRLFADDGLDMYRAIVGHLPDGVRAADVDTTPMSPV